MAASLSGRRMSVNWRGRSVSRPMGRILEPPFSKGLCDEAHPDHLCLHGPDRDDRRLSPSRKGRRMDHVPLAPNRRERALSDASRRQRIATHLRRGTQRRARSLSGDHVVSRAALEPPEPRRGVFPVVGIDLVQPIKRHRMPPRFLLYLGRLDGGPTRLITPDSDEVFAWAADSLRFVYSRSLLNRPTTVDHSVPPRTELVIARTRLLRRRGDPGPVRDLGSA